MKTFLLWLVVFMLGFGGFSGGYHYWLGEHPRKVVVIVDASFPMQRDWSRVPAVLERLQQRPYSVYALQTEKSVVHGFAPRASLGQTAVYAPRDFSRLAQHDGPLKDADEVYLVTNASDAELKDLPGWKVVRP